MGTVLVRGTLYQAMSIDIYHPEKGMEVEMDECWEDDDQRLFYTDFPDLKSLVPMNAWKDSEKVRGGKFASKKSTKTGEKGRDQRTVKAALRRSDFERNGPQSRHKEQKIRIRENEKRVMSSMKRLKPN